MVNYFFQFSFSNPGNPKYPLLFKTLFQMCAADRRKNPPRTDKRYAATQRNFARLRDMLKALILIDGDPFRKTAGSWEPRFQFEPDRELTAMLDYQARHNSHRRVTTPGHARDEDENESDWSDV